MYIRILAFFRLACIHCFFPALISWFMTFCRAAFLLEHPDRENILNKQTKAIVQPWIPLSLNFPEGSHYLQFQQQRLLLLLNTMIVRFLDTVACNCDLFILLAGQHSLYAIIKLLLLLSQKVSFLRCVFSHAPTTYTTHCDKFTLL